MASPQRERGHIDIANEIADKLCSTRISGREWQIIWVVLRKTWGWLENPKTDKKIKKKMDAISKSQFAELTGIPRQKCQELLNKLVSKEILLKGVTLKGNINIATYGFQKDYSKWRVLPKRVTVTLKGNGVLPLKVIEVLPLRVNTKEKKDNTKEKKDKYLDYVFLTQEEHKRLTQKFGERILKEMISELDNYIGAMPKKRNKYTDHNRVLRGWVQEKILGNKSKAEAAPKLPYYPTMKIEKPDGTEKYRDVSKLTSGLKDIP